MVTTHSPAFIDLTRDNTTVVRVERDLSGIVRGTTVFRPARAKLDDDEKRELKLLNIYDPYVAEFFFGGRTVLVEGDTEYTAFKYVIAEDAERQVFKGVHIVRARGKITIGLLAKILNQFGARYAALHDSDLPTTAGGVWTNNERILAAISKAPDPSRVCLVSAVTNFESAMFGVEVDKEKPYNAYQTLKRDADAYGRVKELLFALVDFSRPLPQKCVQWSELSQLEAALAK
jgi:putative ATP-dependent endonuclease of OLD family